MAHTLFFENWYSIWRLAAVGAFSYVLLVAMLRMTGHESLTQMNAVDFVSVVALGNIVAAGITDRRTVAEVLAGLGLFILLRLGLQWLAMRSKRFEKLLNGEPILLFRSGNFLEDEMKKHEVTREEILGAMRMEGIACIDNVDAVVLEVDGRFSVLKKTEGGVAAEKSTLADVHGAREARMPGGRMLEEKDGLRSAKGSNAAAVLLLVAAVASLSACGSSKTSRLFMDKTPNYARDSVTPTSHLIGTVGGFYEPESVRYDSVQDAYFISNVLGEGSAKDGAGYIVKMSASDLSKSELFAVGGQNGVKLDAPKGMAIQGDTLWVADIDVLRGFNRYTGKPVASIDFKPLQAVLLNDVGAGPDGSIYISDTGILMTDKGVIHVGGDKIFQLAPDRSVHLVAQGQNLGRPNGVTWDGKTKRWLVVSFDPWHSQLYALGQPNAAPVVLAQGKGKWDGLEMLADGRAVITSWSDSSVHVIGNGTDRQIIRGVSTPADLGIDTKRGVIAVPQIMGGRVEFWALPRD